MGSNPVTNLYLGSDTFRFFVDGGEHSRTQRADMIKDWKAAVENLRVCWRNADKSKNCGKCEKCIRTKMNFFVTGCDNMPSMPHNICLSDIQSKDLVQKEVHLRFFQEILDFHKKHHVADENIMQTLEEYMKIWAKNINQPTCNHKHHSFWWHLRHMKF